MESTCRKVLELCLAGEPVPSELLDAALEEDGGRAFLAQVVEPLADRFEPRLCDTYASLFTDAIYRVAPELYDRVRRAPPAALPAEAERIYVLSRITLGADIAVTSVILDALKRRYPGARIFFAGPRKNYELWAADPRIEHYPAGYARGGTLRERLEASAALWFDDGVVIDPDSRMTQLGLIQVCPDKRYCFFESRSFGGDSLDRLPELTARWMQDPQAKPYIAPAQVVSEPATITVSLGTGDNDAKSLGEDFELALMRLLASAGVPVLVDLGGSAAERARVERVLQPGMRTHDGSFAAFAAHIARSQVFIGYDSAAGHAASACGVPLISIARGFATARMAARWRPLGTVIDGDGADPLGQVRAALATCTFRR